MTCRFEGPVTQFLIEHALPDVELDVVFLDRYEPPRGELLFDSGGVWRMFAENDGVRIECQTDVVGPEPYKVSTFNSDFTRGTIRVYCPASPRKVVREGGVRLVKHGALW